MIRIDPSLSAICLTLATLALSEPSASAQALGDDLKQSLTGAFLYGIPNTYLEQGPAPGYSAAYAYRPRHWIAFEVGLDQVIHAVGTIEYLNNGNPEYDHINDHLYFVPFGVRFLWSPPGGARRWRTSVGGGGAYLYHHYADPYYSSNSSNVGVQAVASAEYSLSPSGRFRVGLTARYYFVQIPQLSAIERVITIGPSFTFSFH